MKEFTSRLELRIPYGWLRVAAIAMLAISQFGYAGSARAAEAEGSREQVGLCEGEIGATSWFDAGGFLHDPWNVAEVDGLPWLMRGEGRKVQEKVARAIAGGDCRIENGVVLIELGDGIVYAVPVGVAQRYVCDGICDLITEGDHEYRQRTLGGFRETATAILDVVKAVGAVWATLWMSYKLLQGITRDKDPYGWKLRRRAYKALGELREQGTIDLGPGSMFMINYGDKTLGIPRFVDMIIGGGEVAGHFPRLTLDDDRAIRALVERFGKYGPQRAAGILRASGYGELAEEIMSAYRRVRDNPVVSVN